MFDMAGINVRNPDHVGLLKERIDRILGSHRVTGRRQERLMRRALDAPCIDYRFGVYVDLFGIDRIVDWFGRELRDIAGMAHAIITQEDLDLIWELAPVHLAHCRRCLAHSRRYLLYVEQSLPVVSAMAADVVNQYQHEEPVDPERLGAFRDEIAWKAYRWLVSVNRMRQRDDLIRELEEVPCEDRELTKDSDQLGFITFSRLLLSSEHALRRQGSNLAELSPDLRYRILTLLSEHVGNCLHCSVKYDFEKQEASFQDFVYQML